MSQLGFGWFPQTVGLVERNQRPLLADELAALALALETTPDVLALPRLTFRFVRKQFGRLRRLIDEINLADL